jgi:hypothetical protein
LTEQYGTVENERRGRRSESRTERTSDEIEKKSGGINGDNDTSEMRHTREKRLKTVRENGAGRGSTCMLSYRTSLVDVLVVSMVDPMAVEMVAVLAVSRAVWSAEIKVGTMAVTMAVM